jgi:hypothetical protein
VKDDWGLSWFPIVLSSDGFWAACRRIGVLIADAQHESPRGGGERRPLTTQSGSSRTPGIGQLNQTASTLKAIARFLGEWY